MKWLLETHFKGRQYPFDVTGKAFSTLPYLNNEKNRLLTNFDLTYEFMTRNIAAHSDPGIFILSTDMVLHVPQTGDFFINNVIASFQNSNSIGNHF